MTSAELLTRQIQQSVDVVDLVSRHVRLARSGRDFKGLCPFHREKTPSFYVVPTKQIFKCFGCGVGGDVFKFIQLRENVGFLEARRILAEQAGIRLDLDRAPSGTPHSPDRADLAKANAWAQRWFARQFDASSAGKSAYDYAFSRGLSAEGIAKFGLGYAPDSWNLLQQSAARDGIAERSLAAVGLIKPKQEGDGHYDGFRNRLMFPIRDSLDRVIGFGGRALAADEKAKYINSPQSILFDKSRSLYGLEHARNAFSAAGAAILVEGYLDCMMAHQYGFGHTVATLGTSLTEQHVEALRRYVDRVIVVFDSDEAGQRAADRALPLLLTQRLEVRLTCVPDGKDPCDFLQSAGAEAFSSLLNSAADALEFKWSQLKRRYQDAPSGPRRAEAVREFLDLVTTAADWGAFDPIQRGLAVNQIAKLLGIEPRIIHDRLPSGRARPSARGAAEARASGDRRAAGSADPVVSAMRELLEVLLNEPGYYPQVRDHFDPTVLPAPLREVGQAVLSLAENFGEFSIAELTAQFEDAVISGCAIDLQAAGEQRGNYDLSVAGAIARLQSAGRDVEASRLVQELRDSPAPDASSEARAAALGEIARIGGHFLPRKMRRSRPAADMGSEAPVPGG